MSNNLENQKACPSCHRLNKRENNYCRYCGASFEGVEAKKPEDQEIPAITETNKQEIIETMTASKYGKLIGGLIGFTLLGAFFLLGYFGLINYNPSEGGEAVGVAIMAAVLMILFIIVIIGMIIFTGFTLYHLKGSGEQRRFFISDKEIKIMIPDKPYFQIQWSEIVTVQIYKSESWRDHLAFGSDRENPYSRTSFFILKFYGKNGFQRTFGIERGLDFRKFTTERIVSVIEQYANRLHKEYLWGKNIHKAREKRIRRQMKNRNA